MMNLLQRLDRRPHSFPFCEDARCNKIIKNTDVNSIQLMYVTITSQTLIYYLFYQCPITQFYLGDWTALQRKFKNFRWSAVGCIIMFTFNECLTMAFSNLLARMRLPTHLHPLTFMLSSRVKGLFPNGQDQKL